MSDSDPVQNFINNRKKSNEQKKFPGRIEYKLTKLVIIQGPAEGGELMILSRSNIKRYSLFS